MMKMLLAQSLSEQDILAADSIAAEKMKQTVEMLKGMSVEDAFSFILKSAVDFAWDIFIAILMYCKKYKVKLLEVVDMICVATPFTAGCIRIGNLMNSEIVGKATGTDWGFIFAALGEDFPRHPAQLYEAIAYFIIFIISILIYKKHKDMVGSGFYFGFCLATIFTFRFFVEFCKEVQVDFEEGMALDMGQILSIPFMLIGAYFIYRGIKLKIKAKNIFTFVKMFFVFVNYHLHYL